MLVQIVTWQNQAGVHDPSDISYYYKERVASLFVSTEDNKYEIFINIKVPLYYEN